MFVFVSNFKSRYSQIVVIDLDPVAVRITKINLPDAVYAQRYRLLFSKPVFIRDAGLIQVHYKLFYGGHTEAQVAVFVVFCFTSGTTNKMQVAVFRYLKPGMPAIMKRFRNRI
jgi:hypothetical protein